MTHSLQSIMSEVMIDYLARLVETEQYEKARGLIEVFLVDEVKRFSSRATWLVYKAYRADNGTPDHKRQVLPKNIGFWLSGLVGRGVSLSDIMELYELPGWLNQFNWVALALTCRDELQRLRANAPHRLPDHIWTVIQATWKLVEADAAHGLRSLRLRVEDEGYGFAKNLTAFTLAWEAIRDFIPLEDEQPNPGDADVHRMACCASGR